MRFDIITITVRSITIELQNDDRYCPGEKVALYLDGVFVKEADQNVCTLCGLLPDREYSIAVLHNGTEEVKQFRTLHESVLLDVKSFGAVGDGKTLDTAALQAAISACPINGTVYLPRGKYLSGPLFLKSHIHLWIDTDAVLWGDTRRDSYPVLPGMTLGNDESSEYNCGTWEGNPLDCFASLLTGIDVDHVTVFGEGMIDGNAQSADWWENAKVRRTAWRPRTVFLCRCEDVLFQGVTVQNSPSWTIHPYYSDRLSFLNVKIRNPEVSPNTDGLDPESSSDVLILGCDIAVGDDCIAIKSGKYYMALKHHKPTQNIIVRNCLLRHGHGSVTIGSECAGGVYGVLVTKCIFEGTDRGLRIKTRRGRGARSILDDIVFEHITMRDVRMPFTINMFYFCDPDGHSDFCQSKEALPVTEMTPEIRGIQARDIDCDGADVCVLCAYGLPEKRIGELSFSDITVSFRDKKRRKAEVPAMMDGLSPMSGRGIYVRNVEKLLLQNITIIGAEDEESDIINVEHVETEGVSFVSA